MSRKAIYYICLIVGTVCILAAALITSYNVYDDHEAKIKSEQLMEKIREEYTIPEIDELSDTFGTLPVVNNSEICISVENEKYIGVIQIPVIDIELPVQQNISSNRMKSSPCRYSGTAAEHNLIIAAHNYSSHFGKIDRLSDNDIIKYIDVSGGVYIYKVKQFEIIDGKDVDKMMSGEWDITLFTCTSDGKKRITVRGTLCS